MFKLLYHSEIDKTPLIEKFEEHAEVFVTSFLKEKGETSGNEFFCNIEKVYTLGKTSAVVLKASFGIIGSDPYVRILKYDYYEKLLQEEKNWKLNGGDRQGNIFIPRYENPILTGEGAGEKGVPVQYGMLPLTEAAEATMADTVDAVINFIYEKYRTGTGVLRYQAARIGTALAHAFDTLCETMYQTVAVSDKTLHEYFSEKIDADKIADIDKKSEPFIQELAKQGIDVERQNRLMESSCPALVAHRAIHGDLNPGNILICEGRGLMGVFTVLIDLMEVNTRWKPFYWDAARLECEIILSFYGYLHSAHSIPEVEIYESLSDLITVLDQGRVTDLHFDMSAETGRGGFYLYTIFRTMRLALFNHSVTSGRKSITREILYRNHLYSTLTFYRFFMKWGSEPHIKRKCALVASRSVEELFQQDIKPDPSWYSYSSRHESDRFSEIIRSAVRQYIPIESNVKQVLEFIAGSSSDILWLEGFIGSGKSSLMAYTVSLIKGSIQAPLWADELLEQTGNVYIIPWFLSGQAIAFDLVNYLFEEVPRIWPDVAYGSERRISELFSNLSNLLFDKGERLILFIDGVDVDPDVLKTLPSDEYVNISVVYSGRAAILDRQRGAVLDLAKNLSGKYGGREERYRLKLFSMQDCFAFLGTLPAEMIKNNDDIAWIVENSGGLPAYLAMIHVAMSHGMTVEDIRNSTMKRIGKAGGESEYEKSLYSLYEHYFISGLDHSAIPVLLALSVTILGEPVSERFITEIINSTREEKIDPVECKRRIGLCAGLLEQVDKDTVDSKGKSDVRETWHLRHQSIREFFESSDELYDLLSYSEAVKSIATEWNNPVDDIKLYALKYAVKHCCENKDYASAVGLLSDFDYLMEKTRAGFIEVIFEDYNTVMREVPVQIKERLLYREAFFRERKHILRRGNEEWPAYKILLQLAVEHADNSPLTVAAEKYIEEGKVDWVWLRRNQRLEKVGVNPCIAVFEGHADAVLGALELKDGRILSWSRDKTLRIWSSDGNLLKTLEGHTSRIEGALELQDGCILSWSDDNTLRIWSSDGDLIRRLEGHSNGIGGALELQDGCILSWSWDNTLRIWSSDGDFLRSLEGHTDGVPGALELKDGRILSWSGDKTLRIWTNDGDFIRSFEGHTHWVLGAIELKDGPILSWSWDNTLRIWSSDGDLLRSLEGHADRIEGTIELKDGRILSWSGDNTLRIWSSDGDFIETVDKYESIKKYPEFRLAIFGEENVVENMLLRFAANTAYLQNIEKGDGFNIFWHGESTCAARLLYPDGRAVVTLHNGQVCFLSLYCGNRKISLDELNVMYAGTDQR